MYYVIKVLISAILIVGISELSKRRNSNEVLDEFKQITKYL